MGYYLYDHPPASPQWHSPRRAPLSGLVGFHNTDGPLDRILPDSGAENVAGFIARRADPGSYHELTDLDSTVVLLPDDVECYGVETGENRHAWQMAIAARSGDLDPDHPDTITLIGRAAFRIVAFWQRNGFDVAKASRWLTAAEAHSGKVAGLCHHGVMQPSNRTDAWVTHPRHAELDQLLLDQIALANGGPPPTQEDEDMATAIIITTDGKPWYGVSLNVDPTTGRCPHWYLGESDKARLQDECDFGVYVKDANGHPVVKSLSPEQFARQIP